MRLDIKGVAIFRVNFLGVLLPHYLPHGMLLRHTMMQPEGPLEVWPLILNFRAIGEMHFWPL